MRVHKHPQAKRDIIEQAEYIAKDNPDAASQFVAALEEALQRLAHMPHIGSLYETANSPLDGMRSWRIRSFEQHLIFYTAHEDHIELIRVLHAKRDIDAVL